MDSHSDDGFLYLDGFGELIWDATYWNGEVQLPAWEQYDLTWLAENGFEVMEGEEGAEEEDDDDEFADDFVEETRLSPEEIAELRQAAATDPMAKMLLEAIEQLEAAEEELEEDINAAGWVTLSFPVTNGEDAEDLYGEEIPAPRPEQVAAAKYARDNAAEIQAKLLENALEIYQRLQPTLKKIAPEAPKWPRLAKPEDLKDHVRLVGLSPLMVAKDGVAYTAYYLACTWDLDDGLPYIFHKNRLVTIALNEDFEENLQELLDDGGTRLG
jgi:hypothetical protein